MAPGEHRWNPALLSLVERYGYMPKVCSIERKPRTRLRASTTT